MKLLYQTHSPYARKVLVLAHEKGLLDDLQVVHMETSPINRNEDVFKLNPLGKVPVLMDGEKVIYDSSVICEYLSRKTEDDLQDDHDYWYSKQLEALATGMADAGILARWELVRRPHETRYQPFLDGQLTKLFESYQYIEDVVSLTFKGSVGEIALATVLSWIEYSKLPFCKTKYPKLAQWYDSFCWRPSMVNTAYSGTTQDT